MPRWLGLLVPWVLALGMAQGVRSLGLGGLLLPGPWASYYNPAYAAYPSETYGAPEGFRLPLGLVGLLRQNTNPFNYFFNKPAFLDETNGFDLLAFYDQVTHLDAFLFNPARSPDQVVFEVSASGVQIRDGQGNPLNPWAALGTGGGGPTALTPPPFLGFSFPLGSPGLALDLGLFLGLNGLRVAPNEALREGRLAPNTTYALEGTASAQAGVSLGLAYAMPLLDIPGVGRLYAGLRGEGFYGLGYAEVWAQAEAKTDGERRLSSSSYEARLFYSYPGQGLGYGARMDLGVALDLPLPEEALLTLGLGVRDLLGFARWEGREYTLRSDGSRTEAWTFRKVDLGLRPAFYFNTAYRQGDLLAGADLRWEGVLSGRVGLEYGLGPFRLRGGVGAEGGRLVYGLGGGFREGSLTLDAALTAHQAPLVGGTVYGLALSLGF